jgi:hypothetical protein
MALYEDETFQLANPEDEQPDPSQYVLKGKMGPVGAEQNYYEKKGVNRGGTPGQEQGVNAPTGQGIDQDFAFLNTVISKLGYNPYTINPTGDAVKEFQANESRLFQEAFGNTGMTPSTLTPEALKYWNEQKQQLIQQKAAELSQRVTQGKELLGKVMDMRKERIAEEKKGVDQEQFESVTGMGKVQRGTPEYEQRFLEFMQKKNTAKALGTQAPAMEQASKVAEAIMNGSQPPELSGFGMSRIAPEVRKILADQGFDLTKATQDWLATKKVIQTMNGPQQVRLRQAVGFAYESLDIIENLAKQWDAGGFPLLNSAALVAAEQGAMGKDAQKIATQLKSQIADMTSELGTVYKGGNSSTDESLKLAAENLKAKWSKDTLLASVQLVRQNLRLRQNSIKHSGYLGTDIAQPDKSLGGQPQKEAAPATKKRFTIIGVK